MNDEFEKLFTQLFSLHHEIDDMKTNHAIYYLEKYSNCFDETDRHHLEMDGLIKRR